MRWLFIVLLVLSIPAYGFQNEKPLSDPESEADAQKIFKSIRCLVCQGESLNESNADLAVNMRSLIREKVAAGDSDKQIRDYLVWRYGETILQKPPFDTQTYILWLLPAVLLIFGFVTILRKVISHNP